MMKMFRQFLPPPEKPRLMFEPRAWLKLQYLCHAGPTEVAGFGLSSPLDPLRIEDFLVVQQHATAGSVAFDDVAIADLFDRMTDQGIAPNRFFRVWLHTHPGASVDPSPVDEETFERVFGSCDWAVMGILGRTGRTYARLRFSAGPGGFLDIPTIVDWSLWPAQVPVILGELSTWEREYQTLVEPVSWPFHDSFLEIPPCQQQQQLHQLEQLTPATSVKGI